MRKVYDFCAHNGVYPEISQFNRLMDAYGKSSSGRMCVEPVAGYESCRNPQMADITGDQGRHLPRAKPASRERSVGTARRVLQRDLIDA